MRGGWEGVGGWDWGGIGTLPTETHRRGVGGGERGVGGSERGVGGSERKVGLGWDGDTAD